MKSSIILILLSIVALGQAVVIVRSAGSSYYGHHTITIYHETAVITLQPSNETSGAVMIVSSISRDKYTVNRLIDHLDEHCGTESIELNKNESKGVDGDYAKLNAEFAKGLQLIHPNQTNQSIADINQLVNPFGIRGVSESYAEEDLTPDFNRFKAITQKYYVKIDLPLIAANNSTLHSENDEKIQCIANSLFTATISAAPDTTVIMPIFAICLGICFILHWLFC